MFRWLFLLFLAVRMLPAQMETPRAIRLDQGLITVPINRQAGDFSIAVNVPAGAKPAVWLEAKDLLFKHAADGSVTFRFRKSEMSTSLDPAKAHAVVASIKRDPRQALAGLWVDGVEVVSCSVPPGDVSLTDWKAETNVTLYERALTRPEVLEWGLQQVEPDGLAVIGGTEAVALVESGYLEAMWPDAPRLRSLAWEGDTAFRQDRPLNFGSLEQQLKRVNPKSVMLFFGRQECLENGKAGVAGFAAALRTQLKAWKLGGWLVGPVPFESKKPPLPDLSPQNDTLKAYNEALKALAAELQMNFIDLIAAWPKDKSDCTRDGLQLTDVGCKTLAGLLANALSGGKAQPADAAVVALVQQKNHLWNDYWRPSNWAFLYGDRTGQPSSRDHLNPSVRWFPQELENYRTLIAQKENELWKRKEELGRKLP